MTDDKLIPLDFSYYWLVEEFFKNSSTGHYMLDQGGLTITTDVYAAKRLRRPESAGFRALDMQKRHGGDWRPAEHGFARGPGEKP